MILPYEFVLFGIAFFGFMTAVNVVVAYRKGEKSYYLGAIVCLLMIHAFILVFLNRPTFAFFLIVAVGALSIAGLPKLLKAQRQELAKQLQKADLSAPLKLRDFFTNTGWLKLASKWGLRKTMFLFYLLSVVINGGIFFILSIFYAFITIEFVMIYAITFPILFTIICYRQIRNVLERGPSKNRKCGQCHSFTYLNSSICETLNLARNPFSLWFRIRLGYGLCLIKNKAVRHGASACSDYEER